MKLREQLGDKMKKYLYLIFSFNLFIYIMIYKIYFVYSGELMRYIINPLIWILFAILIYFIGIKDYPYFKNEKYITYTVMTSALLYVIFYYTLGLFFEYLNNPYSLSISGIIINFFSILLILGLKEFIRGILISGIKESKLYLALVFFIFFIADLNIMLIIDTSFSLDNLIIIIGKYIIPPLAINLFCTYLVINGGYIVSMLYRLIIVLPSLILPVVPEYNWIIPTLFDILFPLFTFITIEYAIYQRNRLILYSDIEQINPNNWLIIFRSMAAIVIFSLGGFGVKPVVVVTGSMQPVINEGDLVLIADCNIEQIKVGDIIQYQMRDYTIIHRVVRVKNKGNKINLITKGDNNNNEDKYPVTTNNLIGCYKFKIPYLGYPTYLIKRIFTVDEEAIQTGG